MINKNKVLVGLMAIYFVSMLIVSFIKADDEYSDTERRKLKQMPEANVEDILEGSWMSDFEEYVLDQFPLRENFRAIKAYTAFYGLLQKDNNGIYISDGYISKLEYPLNEKGLYNAINKFTYIYDTFLKDNEQNVYYAVVPDKNYFMAKENGYINLDYNQFFSILNDKLSFMNYIDIVNLLELTDYYKTDIHWKQECIEDVAKYIGSQMGVELLAEYEKHMISRPFYGVYYGQLALPIKADNMFYLNNQILSECKVTDLQNNREIGIYDMELAEGKDPYEMFLSGSLSLITIENPKAETDKELIMFRDSFGSSIAPLLVDGYSKITLVDIRYISSQWLDKYIEFDSQDILFLYSVPVLNNGELIK